MKVWLVYLCGVILVLAAVLVYFVWRPNDVAQPIPLSPVPPLTAQQILENAVNEKLASMSNEEKVGQLLIGGLEHTYVDTHVTEMITKYHMGGLNLLGRNIKNAEQTQKLTSDLQALSSSTPLMIATDQEGGQVIRFKFLKVLDAETTVTSENDADRIAFDRGQELADLGVNTNFAPVIDYVSMSGSYLYDRTFATSAEATGKLGVAMAKAYKRAGIISVAKHFPGYGNITPDPHKNAVILNISKEEFEQNLVPFKVAIESGQVPAIMTAHIIVLSIDSEPATLSHVMLTDILRNQLGFDGVIITDDLEMASVGTKLTAGDLAVQSILAGADMVISTYTPEKHIEIIKSLTKAVEEGTISEERLNESVQRILRMKFKQELNK